MAPIEDGSVHANGLRLDYRVAGAPHRPAVLILHGLSGNAWEWDPITEALGERYHVFALNQRGHGSSEWAGDYGPEHMAEDIAAVIEALGLERPVMLGHSMGGINAMLFAAAHPDALSQLVLCDIGPDSLEGGTAEAIRSGLDASERARYTGVEDALGEWISATTRPNEDLLRHYVEHNIRQLEDGTWAWRFDAAGLRGFLDARPSEERLWEAVEAIACPTLVLRAAESPILSGDTAEAMAKRLRDGRWLEIPESGHDLHIDQTDRVLSALLDFLD